MQPCELTASDAAALIRDRELSVEELTRSCLARIASRDAVVKAWLFLDPDLAIKRARELDKRAAADWPMGALHGLGFGVKDVIDTADMPTTHNSPIYEGSQPGRDAACVGIVRASGALILGKTDTVEFAAGGRKALSTNPFNPQHTPGGSSSGSGAAVGDFQVPLGFGTQTGGSHIRPASFNNIYGLKPSWSLVSREGARMSSATLDTVGWYGRCVADLRLVAECFRLPGLGGPKRSVKGLRIGVCRSPVWHYIEPAGVAALEAAAQRLEGAGAIVEELVLPPAFDGMAAARDLIAAYEGAGAFLPEYLSSPHIIPPDIRARVEARAGFDAGKLRAAYTLADQCRATFDALFGPKLDAVLTPASPGDAPEGLHTTGDAIFNGIWTLLQVPCLGIPCIRSARGLPVGIQLVGPRFADAALIEIAEACAPVIDAEPDWARKTLFA
ncbi:amidase [Siccirubricoccus sp. KC 17139]|uniref:Amidase n=1 Tax=Siccirubricoccus soli TaxID=2899147 RepID=A0ABT1D4E5_9PROT|nr:amidase [Siccirubricoccus soli]MCO6416795.1 amidase [Siccirubricoccus soli]MCP2682930.1 amidase [Siccirubricoccus soli]